MVWDVLSKESVRLLHISTELAQGVRSRKQSGFERGSQDMTYFTAAITGKGSSVSTARSSYLFCHALHESAMWGRSIRTV